MSDEDANRHYDRMIVYLRNANYNYGIISYTLRATFPASATRVLYLLHRLGMR